MGSTTHTMKEAKWFQSLCRTEDQGLGRRKPRLGGRLQQKDMGPWLGPHSLVAKGPHGPSPEDTH